jgi:hypothetical protein
MGNLTVINVTNAPYNADNSGATDTSDAINAALAAVPVGILPNVAAGAIVYFPRGTYLINKPLRRQVSFTRCVGEGKNATVILLDPLNWVGTVSPADPAGAFIFDLESYMVTDCTISDMLINGSAKNLPGTAAQSNLYSGILCSARDEIARVRLFDIWGFGLWIESQAPYTAVVDCDADHGFNPHYNNDEGSHGNDCIGGGSLRSKIVRFYWFPTLDKNSALDFTRPGGPNDTERSVDIIDCSNESSLDVVLEGLTQSSIRGCRFYGNTLTIQTNAAYVKPGDGKTIINPADILVADNIFSGINTVGQFVKGSCKIHFDGGDNLPVNPDNPPTNLGGRVAIVGNAFEKSYTSAIEWGGDDVTTSIGGSVIADNRIYDPNQSGEATAQPVPGAEASLGLAFGCGITILSSYGLTIGRNTINDDSPEQNMLYSMQLVRADIPPSGATQPIVVSENLCGSSPGVGNGRDGTFYFSGSPSASKPLPILHRNTNQATGYDADATSQILSAFNGVPWPGAGGYPYDAIINITGININEIEIDGSDTGLKEGSFYLQAGQQITIGWTGEVVITVFRV